MVDLAKARQFIEKSKNICILPSQTNEPENIAAALALFYTLKESNKNVNLIVQELPEKLRFLAPSLDFISHPKNLVISIPQKSDDVSQIYYEKNDQALKIHLTLDKGNVRKEDISFHFSEIKPDLIITLGAQDFKVQLSNNPNSSVLDINNIKENKNCSFSEIIIDIIKPSNGSPIKKEAASCLLAGLIIYTDNFKNSKTTAEIFKLAGLLTKNGADIKEITNNI
ncbi:MAG: hypothetical protein HYT35_00330 [Candidatus Staskawiczbacteria bacterium]|nr:hypothetical protein [Candidatus Staskawiczbacteria bacterium]